MQKQAKLYGQDFKVGMILFDLVDGKCKAEKFEQDLIHCRFSNGKVKSYSQSGYEHPSDKYPTLFFRQPQKVGFLISTFSLEPLCKLFAEINKNDIPDWVKWVTLNKHGEVSGWKDKPELCSYGWTINTASTYRRTTLRYSDTMTCVPLCVKIDEILQGNNNEI